MQFRRRGSGIYRRRRRRPVPKMLRVISRPITVPAERIALLNAGLSITCSRKPGSGGRPGAGIGGTSTGGGTSTCGGTSTGGGASLAANRS